MQMLRYIVITLIVLMAGALVGWYFYLRQQTTNTTNIDGARGLNQPVPTFEDAVGSTYNNIVSAVTNLGKQSENVDTEKSASLWHVLASPVAGFGWQGSSTLVYVERATGHIFSADANTQSTTRLVGTLVPKTYEALIGDGGTVVRRSINDDGAITTSVGILKTAISTTTNVQTATIGSTQMPDNIVRIAINPITHTLAYTALDGAGTSLYVASANGVNPKKLFTSSISGWQIFTQGEDTILVQNASDDTIGYAYRIGKNGTMQQLFATQGLVLLPHAKERAYLISRSADGALALFARTASATTSRALGLKTTAEKCAWLPGSSLTAYCAVPRSSPSVHFLDDWYRGIIHTSDAWWQVNAIEGSARQLAPSGAAQTFDVENPVIDSSGNYVAFRNATDESLWIMKIEQ